MSPADDVHLALLLDLLARGKDAQFIARGPSMRTALEDGDSVRLAPCLAPPNMGDVVLVQRDADLLLHRVVGLRGAPCTHVLLMGDHCPAPDGWFAVGTLRAVATAHRRGGGPWRPIAAARPPRRPALRVRLARRAAHALGRLTR